MKITLITLSLIIMSGCAAQVTPESEPSPALHDAGPQQVATPDDASAPTCECPMYEDQPTATANYVGDCGEFALYEEHGAGVVSSLFVCTPKPPAPPEPIECYCCVWMPGTSYPDGVPYCMHGATTDGATCYAVANDTKPEWSPEYTTCGTDNAWGKP